MTSESASNPGEKPRINRREIFKYRLAGIVGIPDGERCRRHLPFCDASLRSRGVWRGILLRAGFYTARFGCSSGKRASDQIMDIQYRNGGNGALQSVHPPRMPV